MQSEDLLFFPTLVRSVPGFLTTKECDTIVSNLDKFASFTRHNALTGDSRSNHNNGQFVYILNDIDKIFPINERVFQEINHYSQQLGTGRIGIDNSWINVQGPGSELKPHTHPMSIVSGAIYIKVDDSSSGIQFANPNPYLDMVHLVEHSLYTTKKMSIRPKIGDLLLFPSWLKHSSDDANQSDQRIVLSFNTGYINNKTPC